MTKRKVRTPRLPLLVLADAEIEETICRNVANFVGSSTTLSSALGTLIFGQHYGWRAIRMMHSPSTVRKYERILGVRFEEVCIDEYTALSERLNGIYMARKLGAFWDVVMGRKKVDGKGELQEPKESLDG